jgi:hypothetical protein
MLSSGSGATLHQFGGFDDDTGCGIDMREKLADQRADG